jgi:hypothetical protein
MNAVSRRARRPDSLAAAVVGVLGEFGCPLPTSAVRVILNDRGREVRAEHLGRLAAYERDDFLRTRLPPRLCAVIDPDARAVRPRWWALGEWRLQRRIMTEDVRAIWFATMAVRLCLDLADRREPPGSPIVTLALGSVARAIGSQQFDVPASRDEWMALRERVYAPYIGALNNLDGPTGEQHTAEAGLMGAGTPPADLYFGRAIS